MSVRSSAQESRAVEAMNTWSGSRCNAVRCNAHLVEAVSEHSHRLEAQQPHKACQQVQFLVRADAYAQAANGVDAVLGHTHSIEDVVARFPHCESGIQTASMLRVSLQHAA